MDSNTKYTAIKDDIDLDGIDCEHPMCDPMHKGWWDSKGNCTKPYKPRPSWVIIDTTTGERSNGFHTCESFSTRRDALAAIAKQVARDERSSNTEAAR